MLKPNMLAFAVASVLAGSAYAATARAAETEGAGYVQKAAPATPDAAEGAAADQSPAGDEAARKKKAQDEATVMGEITVTGVRAAIEQGISVKQNSNEIVEAISAEDIGKLPDNSIAESLARLPGITAQRVSGRAQTLSIRGFSGDFNGTLLNGREQVSTGDNRAIEFDQYPSELLSGVVVYKTPEASLVGQGISGTVDMQTVRPLNYSKRVFQVGIRGETNTNGSINSDVDSKGYRFNASYIDQYFDHTLGLAIGYARLKSPVQDTRWESWGYPTITGPDGTQALAMGGTKVYPDSVEGTRDAVMATVEWRPNEQYTSTVDLYWSKFDQTSIFRGFEAGFVWGNNVHLSNPIVENGFLTSGTWSNVKPVLRDELDEHNDDIKSIGWNNKFKFGDYWTAVADLSYGKAKADQTFLEEYAGTVPGTPGASDTWFVTQDPKTGLPHFSTGLNYADTSIIKLTDSGGWGQDGYIKFPKTTDELKAARFDLSRDINSPISKVAVGANFNERTKTRNSAEYFLNLPDSANGVMDFPSNCLVPSVNLGFVGFGDSVSWDLNCVLPLYERKINYNQDITNKDWLVKEKVHTGYVKFDLDTEVAGLPLRGNFGAQYVKVDQNSDAYAVANADAQNGVTGVHGGTSYSNFLPDMNLVLSLPYEQVVRFGAGKQIARPRLDQMRASTEYSIELNPSGSQDITTCTNTETGATLTCRWKGNGGNPDLKPFLANAYDLSWEKYWETRAYVAATLFYKKLKTYVYSQDVEYDFTGLDNPTDGVIVPASNIGIFNQPVNGQGGYMRGYELTASVPMDIFTPALDGFGVVASYSNTNSSIEPNGPGSGSQPFPGLSKRVLNVTAYFEKAGFSARIASRKRSDFLGEVTGFGADRSFVYVRAETVTDLQIGYQFQSGSFEGVNLLLQVNNLTDAPYRTFNVTHQQPMQYTKYGEQILLGINYKF